MDGHRRSAYADDTICVAQTQAAMNRILRAVDLEGAKYGLKLNKKNATCLNLAA